MPRIPIYLASVDYRPPRGDLSEAGASGRMLAQFGAAAADLPAALLHLAARSSAAPGDFADAIGAQAKKADLAKKAEQAQAEAERARGTAQAWQRLRETIDGFAQDSDPDTIMDRWQARRGEIGQEISAGIANPEARAETERDFDNLAATQTAFLRRHVIGQIAEQGRRDLGDHLAAYADHATDARHPVEWDDAVDLALREIHNKAAAGFITAAEAHSLEQGFHADIADRQAQRAIAADPQAALADLKDGEAFAALPAARRARLIDEAGRAVQAQALRQETEAAAAKRTTLARLPGYMESLRDGDAPDGAGLDRASLIATLGKDEGEQHWTRIERARAFGQQMAAVRWATPDEIAEKLKADTDPDSPLHQAVARRDAQLSDKPADYVLKNPHIADLHAAVTQATSQPKPVPAVSMALQAAGVPVPAAGSDEGRRAAIAAYANASLAEQDRLGVPGGERQVLPEADAQDLVAQITAGDPPQADRTLRGLAADWGDAWPIVSADLERAGLPIEYRLLAGIENPAARQTFSHVLTDEAKEPGAIRAKIGADAEAIDDIADRRKGEGLLSDDRSKPVKLLAYHYARLMEPEAAVDRALADLGSDIRFTSADSSEANDVFDVWLKKVLSDLMGSEKANDEFHQIKNRLEPFSRLTRAIVEQHATITSGEFDAEKLLGPSKVIRDLADAAVTDPDVFAALMMLATRRRTSLINRRGFASYRRGFWKEEAAQNPSDYSANDIPKMKQGKAAIGADGHPMELHHVDQTMEGGTKPMTRTDHRLGSNYRKNHPKK